MGVYQDSTTGGSMRASTGSNLQRLSLEEIPVSSVFKEPNPS